jgi:dihydrofolate reductase
MRTLTVFNQVSLDGFFVDRNGDMQWAHKHDPEWQEFVTNNARGGGMLVFGRMTYEQMIQYWPTPQALKNTPVVAERMNNMPKVVFSKTLDKATWNNTMLVKGDPPTEMRKMKEQPGPNMVILGSGSIVSQMAEHGLVDEFQIVINPLVLGQGRTLFSTVRERKSLKLTKSRTFQNGSVLLCYQPA